MEEAFSLRDTLQGWRRCGLCGTWAPTSFSRDEPAALVVVPACVRACSLVRSCRCGTRDRWVER
eukprot:scaffold1318_cov362-Pavlova_lutheri.AAC.37